ncbi:MAG: hypothetical protein ACE5IK_11170 [Acidobacteriota bacterium]
MTVKHFLFRLTSYVLISISGLHLVAQFAGRPAPTDATGRTLFDLMRTYHFDFFGLQRTMTDFLVGYSLSFVAFAFFVGVLNLAVLRFCGGDRAFIQTVLLVDILLAGVQFAISLRYFVHPPIISFGLAFVGFSATFFARDGAPAS